MDFKLNNYLFNLIQNHRLVLVKPTRGFAPTNTTFPSCPTHFGEGIMFNQIFRHDEQNVTALLLEEWYYIRPHNYYTFAMEKDILKWLTCMLQFWVNLHLEQL